MKSEPDVYSIDQLKLDKTTPWEGVRNYQARNFMRDDMAIGDKILFYHSNATPPGIAGLATVSRLAYPDFTAWDTDSKYFDPKTDPQKPRWMMVDVAFESKFSTLISLNQLKTYPELSDMLVIKKGMRLSIQPVTASEYHFICALANSK